MRDGSQARATLVLCAAAALFEGFDNQSMGVAAPMLFREFSIAPAQGGLIFSAATLGLFLGALIGGRAADYVGRKQTLTASLLLFGLCSLLTVMVHGAQSMILMRLLTGLGLGGAMPNFIALASDAADPQRKLSAVPLFRAPLPSGGALAGVRARAERMGWGWRAIFIGGGLGPILVAFLMMMVFRARAAYGAGAHKGPGPAQPSSIDSVGTVLWGMGRTRATLLLWTGFFFTNLVLFLMLNWLPSLVIGLGFSRGEASMASIGFNLAGSIGAAFLGRLHAGARRRQWVLMTYGGISLSLAALAAVASFGKAFSIAMLACALAGAFIIGAQLILYALAPLYYRRSGRATGVGAAVAIGRSGSVVGQLFAATMLASGSAGAAVLAGAIPFVVVAGAAALALTWQPQSVD